MPLVARPVLRTQGSRPARGDYQIFEGEMLVGRIYQVPDPADTTWFWTLSHKVGEPGAGEACGLSETLEQAQHEFTAAWQKKLGAHDR